MSEGLGKPNEEIKSFALKARPHISSLSCLPILYIIDLSKPSEPTIAGQIVQEGFDTLQHEWGAGNLIGIGYDADQFGSITA
jgi:uncharacterized secreted protein with C-terminal beta-propeller domain